MLRHTSKTDPLHFLRACISLWLKGVCMGTADLVPGVSGGTMALLLGIYAELIDSIRACTQRDLWQSLLRLHIRQSWALVNGTFLLCLGLGIVTALFLLAEHLERFLEHYPVQIWSFFFGLVLASAVLLAQRVEGWHPGLAALGLLAGILTYGLVGSAPVTTPTAWWFLLLTGAVSICAMILPGISGAYILILLGKYQYILNALNQQDWSVLLLVIAGGGVGLLTFARVLSWLFRHHARATTVVLTGFMLGSIRRLWPWQEVVTVTFRNGRTAEIAANTRPPVPAGGALHPEIAWALGLACLGMAVVFILGHWARQTTASGPGTSTAQSL